MAGPGEVSYGVLCWAPGDPATVRRYRSRLVEVPGSDCLWWDGALSGRGHGRLWLAQVDGRDVAIIAHRFGFALEHGAEALLRARLLGHGCDNPPCQLIGPRHVRPSTAAQNRREWAARRRLVGSPLGDRRGAHGRARALRDAVRAGGAQFAAVEAAGRPPGRQMPLWGPTDPGIEAVAVTAAGVGRTSAAPLVPAAHPHLLSTAAASTGAPPPAVGADRERVSAT